MCEFCTSSATILASVIGAAGWGWCFIKAKLIGDKKDDNNTNTTTR